MMGDPTRQPTCKRRDCEREREPGEEFCSTLCRRINESIESLPCAISYAHPDMKQAAVRYAPAWLDVRSEESA